MLSGPRRMRSRASWRLRLGGTYSCRLGDGSDVALFGGEVVLATASTHDDSEGVGGLGSVERVGPQLANVTGGYVLPAACLGGSAFNVVAYGVSSYLGGATGGGTPRPDLTSTGTRRVAQQTFASLTSGWLRLRMNQGSEVCIGDSGGPSLIGDSDVIAGITLGQSSLSGGQCLS
jgi:hypothetical protein